MLTFSLAVVGCGDGEAPLVRIAKVEGNVEIRELPGAAFVPALVEMTMKHQGAVRTGKSSRATLVHLAHKSVVTVLEDSWYEVRAGAAAGCQSAGQAIFEVEKQQNEFIIESSHGATAVLGTKFAQIVSSDTIEIWVKSGLVEFTSRTGRKKQIAALQKFRWHTADADLPEPESFVETEAETIFGSDESGGAKPLTEGQRRQYAEAITELYLNTLGRKPSQQELDGSIERLVAGKITIEALREEIERTGEYLQRRREGSEGHGKSESVAPPASGSSQNESGDESGATENAAPGDLIDNF